MFFTTVFKMVYDTNLRTDALVPISTKKVYTLNHINGGDIDLQDPGVSQSCFLISLKMVYILKA
jgi:hypothetical protein